MSDKETNELRDAMERAELDDAELDEVAGGAMDGCIFSCTSCDSSCQPGCSPGHVSSLE